MDKLFTDLNEAQQIAVKTTEGPVMAIAGAGSGKTRVLTRRMAHLIFNMGVPMYNILAITFTNKAANEMKERIASLLGVSTKSMWVSTFHSMCARILRTHIELLGYERHFQIIDDDDSVQLIKVILKRLDIDIKLVHPRSLKNHVMNLKTDPSLLEHYEEPIKGYLELIFPKYQKHLKDNNLLDFEDLLVLTIELLKEHEHVRQYYQEQFAYVLVDEFQDTNNVQYDLIALLIGPKSNLFIVGDEDQSIYAFRGANIENIKKFEKDYQTVKRILLEENYRSTNAILEASNRVISHNKSRIPKTLYSNLGDGEPVVFFKGFTYRDETEYVAETIRTLARNGYTYEDMAILYRANSTSRAFEETLMQKHIPYQVVGNTSFFRRKEIKDMVAYLRLIVNPNDNYSFTRVVNEPKRGIGAKTIERLSIFAESEQISMFDAVNDTGNPLGKRSIDNLKAFVSTLDVLQARFEKESVDKFMDTLLEVTGYKEYLAYDDMGDVRYENILELKTFIQETQRAVGTQVDHRDLLTYILEDIALQSREDEIKDKNVVTLMTLHAAKGLEFKVVFIVALEQGLFPLHRALDSYKDLEEERRLMYVGMTRAKEKLFLTNARERRMYGDVMRNPDSVFLQEIGVQNLELEGLNKAVSRSFTTPISHQRKKPQSIQEVDNDLQKGDRIQHKVFGPGLVISVKGEECVIAFGKDYGIKTLMKNHPAIEKAEGMTHD